LAYDYGRLSGFFVNRLAILKVANYSGVHPILGFD